VMSILDILQPEEMLNWQFRCVTMLMWNDKICDTAKEVGISYCSCQAILTEYLGMSLA
jgi:hypothetical protein